MRHILLGDCIPFFATTKAYQKLRGSTPLAGALDIDLQTEHGLDIAGGGFLAPPAMQDMGRKESLQRDRLRNHRRYFLECSSYIIWSKV